MKRVQLLKHPSIGPLAPAEARARALRDLSSFAHYPSCGQTSAWQAVAHRRNHCSGCKADEQSTTEQDEEIHWCAVPCSHITSEHASIRGLGVEQKCCPEPGRVNTDIIDSKLDACGADSAILLKHVE